MHDESKMYEVEYPAPVVDSGSHRGPVLIVALQGFADAGSAIDGAADHLKAALENHPLVSFNNDVLIDYRSRRPVVTLDDTSIISMDDLTLDIRVMKDVSGRPFLLLSGPEPDFRWEGFTRAVADLVDKYNVSATICLYSANMTVPHTRPLVVSAHGNDPEIIGDLYRFNSKIMVPGAAALMLERELHRRGKSVTGLTAHVPNYLASWPYPQAIYQLLQSICDSTHLDVPLRSLEHDIERTSAQLAEYVSNNPEVAQVVASLERQYDEELDKYLERHEHAGLPGERSLPTGEELGAEFESFLASLEEHGDQPGGDSDGVQGTRDSDGDEDTRDPEDDAGRE